MVVWRNASHVDQSVIRGGLVRKKELVTWLSSILERWVKAAVVMKETFGATSRVGVGGSDESRAMATVSGDVKESVCDGEWNLILPNTQSINGL